MIGIGVRKYFNVEYLARDDVKQLQALFFAAVELGVTTVDCNATCPEDEFVNYPIENPKGFIEDIDGGAEEFQIDLWIEDKMIGTTWVVLGNGDYSAFYDYSWKRRDKKAGEMMDWLHHRIQALIEMDRGDWEHEEY